MIVLPMAGLSSRFTRAGYDVPKYMLDVDGRTVFDHALGSFEAYLGSERFLIICRDVAGTPGFVEAACAKAGLAASRLDLVVLEAETAGQAETVAVGLDRAAAPAEERLTIFNIDTFRPGFRYPDAFAVDGVDGYLEVFEGEGTHWSFVRPREDAPELRRAAEVAEKVRISNLCCTGLYHFRTVAQYQDLYAPIAAKDPATLQGGERYIAPLYNDAIARGQDIRYSVVDRSEVVFCGTPEEYEALRAAGA